MVCIGIVEVVKRFMVETKYGQKEKVIVLVEQADNKKRYEASMFVPKSGLPFNIGDQVLADIVIEGKYTNIKRVEPFGVKIEMPPPKVSKESTTNYNELPPDPKEENIVPQSVWDGKELRDFRSRVLAQVSSNIKINVNESELDWADRVIAVAELKFLDYIYNGYVVQTEPTFKK